MRLVEDRAQCKTSPEAKKGLADQSRNCGVGTVNLYCHL